MLKKEKPLFVDDKHSDTEKVIEERPAGGPSPYSEFCIKNSEIADADICKRIGIMSVKPKAQR